MLVPSIFGESVLDDFFNDWTKPVGYTTPRSTIMKTDIKETDEAYEFDIDFPGYKKEDIKVELKDGNLTVSANTQTKKDEKDSNGKYIRRERYVGSCERTFYVGDTVKQEDVSAKFENGILKLAVAKRQPEPEVEENHFISID